MDFYYYFQAREGYFWNWEEGGDVLAIPGGATIAYKEQLVGILKGFSDQGIPQMGPLLLVMIATNKGGEKIIEQVVNILFASREATEKALPGGSEFMRVVEFMENLAELPDQYKTGVRRHVLFQTLFKDSHNIINKKAAKELLRKLANSDYDKNKLLAKPKLTDNRVLIDAKLMLLLQQKFPTKESILSAVADVPYIGEELIEIPEQSGEEQGNEADFIETLISNPKTFHVGALVKRIWAGLNIPYHHTMPSDQPLGGVSDITNKGEFDKLLVSEFANDDLVFLSRLANSEALYYRREVPPTTDSSKRIILIDISIKNWGTPKILAYALLVAIANHPKTDVPCDAFVIGDEAQQIKFDDIHGLIDSMQLLDATLNPAKGLEVFFREHPNPQEMEIFFISTPEGIALPAMQKALSDYKQFFKYFINVDSGGKIDFYRNQNGNKKLIQNLALPLDELWRKKPQVEMTPPADDDTHIQKSPILYPSPYSSKAVLKTEDGEIFIISNERRLFKMVKKGPEWNHIRGLKLMLDNVALGDFEVGKVESDIHWTNAGYLFLVFTPQNKKVEIFNLNTKESHEVYFNDWRSSAYKGFFFHNESFYYMDQLSSWCFNAPNGELKITKKNHANPAEFENLQKAYKNRGGGMRPYIWSVGSILKNINNVYINDEGHLVFNKHELEKRYYRVHNEHKGYLVLSNSGRKNRKIEAKQVSGYRNKYVFPDGSSITFSRSGVAQLASSNPDLLPIFIPTVLETQLGVGTLTAFAGNEYYLDDDYEDRQLKMSINEFWEQYITKFIAHIIEHGA